MEIKNLLGLKKEIKKYCLEFDNLYHKCYIPDCVWYRKLIFIFSKYGSPSLFYFDHIENLNNGIILTKCYYNINFCNDKEFDYLIILRTICKELNIDFYIADSYNSLSIDNKKINYLFVNKNKITKIPRIIEELYLNNYKLIK